MNNFGCFGYIVDTFFALGRWLYPCRDTPERRLVDISHLCILFDVFQNYNFWEIFSNQISISSSTLRWVGKFFLSYLKLSFMRRIRRKDKILSSQIFIKTRDMLILKNTCLQFHEQKTLLNRVSKVCDRMTSFLNCKI